MNKHSTLELLDRVRLRKNMFEIIQTKKKALNMLNLSKAVNPDINYTKSDNTLVLMNIQTYENLEASNQLLLQSKIRNRMFMNKFRRKFRRSSLPVKQLLKSKSLSEVEPSGSTLPITGKKALKKAFWRPPKLSDRKKLRSSSLGELNKKERLEIRRSHKDTSKRLFHQVFNNIKASQLSKYVKKETKYDPKTQSFSTVLKSLEALDKLSLKEELDYQVKEEEEAEKRRQDSSRLFPEDNKVVIARGNLTGRLPKARGRGVVKDSLELVREAKKARRARRKEMKLKMKRGSLCSVGGKKFGGGGS